MLSLFEILNSKTSDQLGKFLLKNILFKIFSKIIYLKKNILN
jgi:hypothetical protein